MSWVCYDFDVIWSNSSFLVVLMISEVVWGCPRPGEWWWPWSGSLVTTQVIASGFYMFFLFYNVNDLHLIFRIRLLYAVILWFSASPHLTTLILNKLKYWTLITELINHINLWWFWKHEMIVASLHEFHYFCGH